MSTPKYLSRTGLGMSAKDGPKLSGNHNVAAVDPNPHGNRAERRAFERLYGKGATCSGDQNVEAPRDE